MILKNNTKYNEKDLKRWFQTGLEIYRKMEEPDKLYSKEFAMRAKYKARKWSNIGRAHYSKVRRDFFDGWRRYLMICLINPEDENTENWKEKEKYEIAIGNDGKFYPNEDYKREIIKIIVHEIYHTRGFRHSQMPSDDLIRDYVGNYLD